MKIKLLVLCAVMCAQIMQARFYVIKNEHQFSEQIQKYRFAMVTFVGNVEDEDKDTQKEIKKETQQLRELMQATAQTDPYKKELKNEILFLVVDCSKNSMESLLEKYGINSQKLPETLLFKDGKVITTMSGNIARLHECFTKSDLLEFMNDYFGKELDEILAKKADAQAAQRDLDIARYQAFAAYRYPYGGYAPYNVWGSPSYSIYTGYAQFYPYGYSYNGYAYVTP